ncbi:tyrosine--tRNA ligase [Candidatus Woesearchaeota archaeon]|jgi:tyrosyl-tRNA synthetase|nr:tyrosine--tRNA ligase [Candidatus Woesearchaeota archaeon]
MNKLDLIKRNTEEIITEEKLKTLLKKKNPRVYCGYEPSGEIHLGHLVTITKLLDLQEAGFQVVILFADYHAFLNQKGDWKFINEQVKHWKKGFKAAGLTKAEFVVGSSFQTKKEYQEDVLKLSSSITINRALRSMQQVARDIENAKVSQVIYPFMQIVDIKHLKLDAVQSGIEQRKIHMMGSENFSKIDCKTPLFIHTPLINSLKGPGSKMSSSEKESFISIRDSDEAIKKKINKTHCVAGEKNSPILEIIKLIIFPRVKMFIMNRPTKFGGSLKFDDYEKLEKGFTSKKIHPLDLKNSVSEYLINIITPIRKAYK